MACAVQIEDEMKLSGEAGRTEPVLQRYGVTVLVRSSRCVVTVLAWGLDYDSFPA